MSMLVTLLASACASTQPITEPVAVIEAFHEALNDGDLDAAMNFVADDARFITDTLHEGKAQVRVFFEGVLATNPHYELSDLKLEGDTVTWIGQVTFEGGGFAPGPFEAVVQNGKIVSLMDL
jgi:ketosteroid isomerase-like protein